jgi:LDH2 family malate/lactate/ureidoglycolate dehydrogenase
MVVVRDHESSALLDAGKGLGYVAAYRAMAAATAKARGRGIAIVGVRNSNHFGIAGYHALLAARLGLIGIAQTNAGAEMAPWGSATPVLGTNPWGIAIPRGGERDPIVLDMALTQSGKGMMRWLARTGLPMPDTWALTPDGRRTTDPSEADQGPLLPIGEYKGYGLSLVTDVLCGVMTGALFGADVFQDDEHFDVGHVMIALDPECFMDRDTFDARLERLLDQVLSAPPIDADVPVKLPGAAEQERARARLRDGIPVALTTVEAVAALAHDLGLTFPDPLPEPPP